MKRTETRPISVGKVQIGGQPKVVIQSMCNIKTSHVDEVVSQIHELERVGCELIRVSIMDEKDARSIREIKERISIPLVADIHFDYRLALLAIEQGIDKIRINPGNIGSEDGVRRVVEACKKHHIPIRIGVNSGSLDPSIGGQSEKVQAEELLKSAEKHVAILEKYDFHDIVISLKGSNVLTTIEAYRLAARRFPYPLHLGITEAGTKEIGIIRSVAGLAPLLLEGIGDTIRISLSGDPVEEVIACKRLLHDIGLYPNYPTLISCPTCGRTRVSVEELSRKVLSYLEEISAPITVAVMGCIVNGPGEAKHADIGIAGGNHSFLLFKKDQILGTYKEEEIFDRLMEEIQHEIASRRI